MARISCITPLGARWVVVGGASSQQCVFPWSAETGCGRVFPPAPCTQSDTRFICCSPFVLSFNGLAEKTVNLFKSCFVTLSLILVNLALQTVVYTFRTWASTNADDSIKQVMMLLASLFTSMQITGADTVYKSVAVRLTENENQ